MRIMTRSKALARRLRSLKRMAAQRNEMITELRRTRETTEIIESGSLNEEKYAKSAMQMKSDMSGIAQRHWNGVVL